ERVPALAEGAAPNFTEMQTQLAQLSRGSDRRVTPVLKQGSAPGTVQLELNVEDQLPLHGNVELNDRYSPNTTHLRLQGMLRYDNLWQKDHSLSLNAQTSPEDTSQVKVLSASYLMPTGTGGSLLALYGVNSRSNVATVGSLAVIGNGSIVG